MTSTTNAAHHHSPHPFARFSRLAAFFSPPRHAPPPKLFREDNDWIPYRAPVSALPDRRGTGTNSPSYMLSTNPFGRTPPSPANRQLPPVTLPQYPQSTFSSGSSGYASIAANPLPPPLPHPYASPLLGSSTLGDAPMTPMKTPKLGGHGLFTFPTRGAPPILPPIATAPRNGGGGTSSFFAMDVAGGIGESPQPIRQVEKEKAPKGRNHYTPFSHHLPHQHHSPKSSGDATAPPSRPKRDSGGSVHAHHQHANIGPATSVRTSLLGFGQQQVGSGAFREPRRAPKPPSTAESTTVEGYGSWIGPQPSSATSEATSTGFASSTMEGGMDSLGRVHGRKLSEGVVGLGAVKEEPTPTKSPTVARKETEEAISPPRATARRRAATHSAEVSPLLVEAFAKQQQSTPSRPRIADEDVHPYAIATPRHSIYPANDDVDGEGSPRYTYVVTPPPPVPGPSKLKPPPIPPKSEHTMRTLGTRTLKMSSSTPNLKERAYRETAAILVGKGKGREVVPSEGHLSRPPTAPGSRAASARANYTAGGHAYPLTPQPSRGNLLQAQTICDAFMFPKPRFVAHLISPPETPEDPKPRPLPEIGATGAGLGLPAVRICILSDCVSRLMNPNRTHERGSFHRPIAR